MSDLKCDGFPEGDVHFQRRVCTCQKAQDSILEAFAEITLPKKDNAKVPSSFIKE